MKMNNHITLSLVSAWLLGGTLNGIRENGFPEGKPGTAKPSKATPR